MSQLQDGKTFNLHPPKTRSNAYRVLVLALLIMGGAWLLLSLQRGDVQSPFNPTPTPTRTPQSYILAAQAYFAAGKLDDPASDQDAIGAYQQAVAIDPGNAQIWAELARIQTYSSSMLSTDQERFSRLQQALTSVEKGVELAPDDSTVYAVYAFVLDWNASSNLVTVDEHEAYLAQAETAANRAYLLNPNNALALAYYAEALLDQDKWDQAKQYATQAVERAPDSMDAHRVLGLVLESWGYYRDAIDEYLKATQITPNFTYFYLRIGLNYRQLANNPVPGSNQNQLYATALEYFEKAANINEQLDIKDPYPYIAIAKTYAQQGEFFIAARNAEKALSFDAANPDTYGQLGMIYVQARNYETALPALRCAVDGCTAAENEIADIFVKNGLLPQTTSVQPLPLTNLNIAYYYVRYGSVLAYLSTPENAYCTHSLELMTQLRLAYPDDPVLMQNVEDNEATCRSLMGTPLP